MAEPFVGPAEQGQPLLVEQGKVHLAGMLRPGEGGHFGRSQPALPDQPVQINQIGVAGEGGEGLVGGVSVTGGADGENLPVALPGGVEKVHKVVGCLAQGPDTVPGGQGGDVQQNTAASIHSDNNFLFMVWRGGGVRSRVLGESGGRMLHYIIMAAHMSADGPRLLSGSL